MEKLSVYIGNAYYTFTLSLYGVKLRVQYIKGFSNYSSEDNTIDIHCSIEVVPNSYDFRLSGGYTFDKKFPLNPNDDSYKEDDFYINRSDAGLEKLKIRKGYSAVDSTNGYLIIKDFPISKLSDKSQNSLYKCLDLKEKDRYSQELRSTLNYFNWSIEDTVSSIVGNTDFMVSSSGNREDPTCAIDNYNIYAFISGNSKDLNVEGEIRYCVDNTELLQKINDFLFTKDNNGWFKTTFNESQAVRHKRRLYY